MDIVEYVERIYGLKLFEYQKRLLRKMKELKPSDVHVFPSRRGYTTLVVPKPAYKHGNKCRIFIVDDINKKGGLKYD